MNTKLISSGVIAIAGAHLLLGERRHRHRMAVETARIHRQLLARQVEHPEDAA
ncbi:hypothetical protein ACWIID_10790 [Streptomyces phaeochromogenes]